MAVDALELPLISSASPTQGTIPNAVTPPLRVPRTGKKKIYFQRDSLKARESRGKEGSRRRNRYDNDHFTYLPHAILNPKDLIPPGYPVEAPRFHFKYDRAMEQLLQHNFVHDIELQALERPCSKYPESQSYIDRSIRRELKKAHVSEGIVEKYEHEIIEFVKQIMSAEHEKIDFVETSEDVSDRDSTDSDDDVRMMLPTSKENQHHFLVMDIQDRQIRFVVHAMCQYYHLTSFSNDSKCGHRLTYICHPRLIFRNSQKVPEIREKTFYEFLFL